MHRQLIAAARAWTMELLMYGYDDPLPEEAILRRITSSAYYALFHAFAAQAADLLALPGRAEYRRVYRALNHGPCKNACRAVAGLPHWSPAIRQCARLFQLLQEARHNADYDPGWVPNQSDTITHFSDAEQAIAALHSVAEPERRAFVLCLLFPERP